MRSEEFFFNGLTGLRNILCRRLWTRAYCAEDFGPSRVYIYILHLCLCKMYKDPDLLTLYSLSSSVKERVIFLMDTKFRTCEVFFLLLRIGGIRARTSKSLLLALLVTIHKSLLMLIIIRSRIIEIELYVLKQSCLSCYMM